MAFVRRLAVVSTLLLTVLSGLLIFGKRALSGSYGCLHLAALATLVDVQTGYSVPTWDSLTEEFPSPDGRFIAYQTTLADGSHNRLYLRATGSELARFLGENIIRFMWSADSRYMAYMWRDSDGPGQFWGTIANADGSDARSTVLGPAVNDFYGLSADNEYVAFSTDAPPGSAINFLSVTDFQLTTIDLLGRYPFRVEWSPRGHDMVYPSYRETGTRPEAIWVSLVSPEGHQVTTSLPGLPNRSEYTWSPDGRTVGVQYDVQTERPPGQLWQTRLDLLGMDGIVIPEVALAVGANEMRLPPVIWSADSRSLVAWNGQAYGSLSLERFYPADGRYETLVAHVPYLLPYSPDQRRATVPVTTADGDTNLVLMAADGDAQMTLIEDPHLTNSDPYYYSVYWSPDGTALTVVWSDGTYRFSSTQLAWALADGSQVHHLLENLGSVAQVLWINDSQAFAYTAIKDERWSVGLVNPHTGTHQILMDNLVSVDSMEADGQSGGVTFRWQTADGQAGFDTYRADGEQLQHFILTGTASRIEEENPPQSVMISPNGRLALLVFISNMSFRLRLVSDEWSRVVRSDITSIVGPLWSPDEQMLALVTTDSWGETGLDVIAADGANVGRFDWFPTLVYAPLMEWTRCEPRPY